MHSTRRSPHRAVRGVLIWAVMVCIIGLAACEKKAPVEAVGQDPEVSAHAIPEFVQEQAQRALFMVKVSDPQGLGSLEQVEISIEQGQQALLNGVMTDDGQFGDILSGDGIYTYSMNPRTTNLTLGNFSLRITATDEDGHSSIPLTPTVTLITGGAGVRPVVSSLVLPDSLELVVDFMLPLTIFVDDPDQDQGPLDLRIYRETSVVPIFQDTLSDDDGTGRYESTLSTDIFTGIRSVFFLRLQARDDAGNQSIPFIDRIFVHRVTSNDPPQVTAVSAPDTLSRTAGNFLVTATVTDPQGLADIDEVTLNSFLPDGSGASDNPFSLFDDGIRGGDVVPNDGTYSVRFIGIEGAATGTYRFEVQARDKSGALSNVVIHLLTVTQ